MLRNPEPEVPADRPEETVARFTLLPVAFLCALLGSSPAGAFFGAGSERPQIGEAAPRFTAPQLDGIKFDLGPHLGKNAILLDFWSIYCVACVQAMPHLVALHERYKDQGFLAVGIDLDSFATKRVAKFIEGLPFRIPYPVVIDKQRQVAARYGVSVLPTVILIDRQGKVAYYHVGYAPGDENETEAKIREILGLAP